MPSTSSPAMQRVSHAVFSGDPKRRLRIMQWMIAGFVYVGAATLLVSGLLQGWMQPAAVLGWCVFVGAVMTAGYVALRTGWSERFADPYMTLWQLSMGVIAVNWGYVICGPMRTAALLPIMVIFAFGAFSLRRRQIAWLTVFALATFIIAIVIRHALPDYAGMPDATIRDPLAHDLNDLLMVIVVVPGLAIVAARLSGMRRALREQRSALGTALGEVKRLATYDELTGVPNRRSMVDAMTDAAVISNQGGTGFCIAMIDLDHFKQINDQLGHAQGDAVLRDFATAASSGLRGSDVFGRWGGEEFLFLLQGLAPDAASAVIARLQARLKQVPIAGRTVTFSAGVSEYRAGETPDATVARADAAMYAAKRGGRDTVRVANEDGSATKVTAPDHCAKRNIDR